MLHHVAIARRLVVAAVNCGYMDFVDNWLTSVRALNIHNFILIALDQQAYEGLMQAYPANTVLSHLARDPNEIVDDKARQYGSEEFGNVVRSRPLLLLPFLEQGYTIFYSDIDTVWKINPFDEMRQGEYDVQAGTDSHPGHPDDEVGAGNLCTGMLYLEATYPTIRLLQQWHKQLIDARAEVNQADFSSALATINTNPATKNMIKLNVVARDALPPGYMYFKNDDRWATRDSYVPKRAPMIIHANWCYGKKSKRDLLKKAGLWKPTGNLLPCISTT